MKSTTVDEINWLLIKLEKEFSKVNENIRKTEDVQVEVQNKKEMKKLDDSLKELKETKLKLEKTMHKCWKAGELLEERDKLKDELEKFPKESPGFSEKKEELKQKQHEIDEFKGKEGWHFSRLPSIFGELGHKLSGKPGKKYSEPVKIVPENITQLIKQLEGRDTTKAGEAALLIEKMAKRLPGEIKYKILPALKPLGEFVRKGKDEKALLNVAYALERISSMPSNEKYTDEFIPIIEPLSCSLKPKGNPKICKRIISALVHISCKLRGDKQERMIDVLPVLVRLIRHGTEEERSSARELFEIIILYVPLEKADVLVGSVKELNNLLRVENQDVRSVAATLAIHTIKRIPLDNRDILSVIKNFDVSREDKNKAVRNYARLLYNMDSNALYWQGIETRKSESPKNMDEAIRMLEKDSETCNYACSWIWREEQKKSAETEHLLIPVVHPLVGVLHTKKEPYIINVVARILHKIITKLPDDRKEIFIKEYVFLGDLLESHKMPKNRRAAAGLIKDIIEYIPDRYFEKLSLKGGLFGMTSDGDIEVRLYAKEAWRIRDNRLPGLKLEKHTEKSGANDKEEYSLGSVEDKLEKQVIKKISVRVRDKLKDKDTKGYTKEDVEQLIKIACLDKEDTSIRIRALSVIGLTADSSTAIETALNLFNDKNEDVRNNAIASIKSMVLNIDVFGDDETRATVHAIAPLCVVIKGENKKARYNAIRSFSSIVEKLPEDKKAELIPSIDLFLGRLNRKKEPDNNMRANCAGVLVQLASRLPEYEKATAETDRLIEIIKEKREFIDVYRDVLHVLSVLSFQLPSNNMHKYIPITEELFGIIYRNNVYIKESDNEKKRIASTNHAVVILCHMIEKLPEDKKEKFFSLIDGRLSMLLEKGNVSGLRKIAAELIELMAKHLSGKYREKYPLSVEELIKLTKDEDVEVANRAQIVRSFLAGGGNKGLLDDVRGEEGKKTGRKKPGKKGFVGRPRLPQPGDIPSLFKDFAGFIGDRTTPDELDDVEQIPEHNLIKDSFGKVIGKIKGRHKDPKNVEYWDEMEGGLEKNPGLLNNLYNRLPDGLKKKSKGFARFLPGGKEGNEEDASPEDRSEEPLVHNVPVEDSEGNTTYKKVLSRRAIDNLRERAKGDLLIAAKLDIIKGGIINRGLDIEGAIKIVTGNRLNEKHINISPPVVRRRINAFRNIALRELLESGVDGSRGRTRENQKQGQGELNNVPDVLNEQYSKGLALPHILWKKKKNKPIRTYGSITEPIEKKQIEYNETDLDSVEDRMEKQDTEVYEEMQDRRKRDKEFLPDVKELGISRKGLISKEKKQIETMPDESRQITDKFFGSEKERKKDVSDAVFDSDYLDDIETEYVKETNKKEDKRLVQLREEKVKLDGGGPLTRWYNNHVPRILKKKRIRMVGFIEKKERNNESIPEGLDRLEQNKASELSIDEYKKRYKKGFLDIEHQYLNHPTGKKTCIALSNLRDVLIEELYKYTIYLARKENPSFPSKLPMAIIAFGGDGRRDICPFSDVDIVFLYFSKEKNKYYKECRAVENVMVKYLGTIGYGLGKCDSQLDYVSGTNNFKEIKERIYDSSVKTALVETRYLCGDKTLGDDFEEFKNNNIYLNYSDAYYHLLNLLHYIKDDSFEKNNIIHLKGGVGLRAIHHLCWCLAGLYNIRQIGVNKILKHAAEKNIITNSECNFLINFYEYLLIIRNDLHYSHMREHNKINNSDAEKKSQYYSKQYFRHIDYLKSHFGQVKKVLTTIYKRLHENIKSEKDTKRPLVKNTGVKLIEEPIELDQGKLALHEKHGMALYKNQEKIDSNEKHIDELDLFERQAKETYRGENTSPEALFSGTKKRREELEKELLKDCIELIEEIERQTVKN